MCLKAWHHCGSIVDKFWRQNIPHLSTGSYLAYQELVPEERTDLNP